MTRLLNSWPIPGMLLVSPAGFLRPSQASPMISGPVRVFPPGGSLSCGRRFLVCASSDKTDLANTAADTKCSHQL